MEYEGPAAFLKEELHDLLAAVVELHREDVDSSTSEVDADDEEPTRQCSNGNHNVAAIDGYVLTTDSYAAKLGGKTGRDLAMSAAARLTLGLKKATFSRADLLAEMKNATSYFKRTFSGNLTATLTRLVADQKLLSVGTGQYALSASTKLEMEAILAG